MLYIKVHKYDADKNPVFINPNCIGSFARNDAHNATIICEQHGTSWWVSETPDEIMQLLNMASIELGNDAFTIVEKQGIKVRLNPSE